MRGSMLFVSFSDPAQAALRLRSSEISKIDFPDKVSPGRLMHAPEVSCSRQGIQVQLSINLLHRLPRGLRLRCALHERTPERACSLALSLSIPPFLHLLSGAHMREPA